VAGLRSVASGLSGIDESLKSIRTNPTEPKGTVYKVGDDIESRVVQIRDQIRKGKVDPKIRQLTMAVINKKCGNKWCIPEKAWGREVGAIFGFIRSKVRYTRDVAGVDTFQHPVRTFQFGGGDCDCIVIALAAMLQSVGYPVKLHLMHTKGADTWSHILLLVGLPPQNPTKWLALDGSVAQPAGWYPPREIIVKTKDFEV